MVDLTNLQINREQTVHCKEPTTLLDIQPDSYSTNEMLDLDLAEDSTNPYSCPATIESEQELLEEGNFPTTSTPLASDSITAWT